jgi:tetratricopeptide (TPR) repeat protein
MEVRTFVFALLLLLWCSASSLANEDAHGEKFQSLQQEGIKFLQVKDYGGALRKFEDALKEHSSWQTLHNIAVCHTQLGQYPKAILAEQQSIEAGGIHANQCITMAGALEGIGQPKQALAWLELACSADPSRRQEPVMRAAIQRLNDPTVNPKGSANSPDYLSGLTAVQKWRKSDFPLKVFVRKNMQIPEFNEEFTRIVSETMDQWCQASNGAISYKLIQERQNANIIWDYTDRQELVSSAHEPGLWAATEMKVHMSDNTLGDGTIVVLVRKGQHAPFFQRTKVVSTCLHEMGHALGMHGHSSNPTDVMFLAATPSSITKLSPRDVNTIRRIYPDLQMQGFAFVNQKDFASALACFNAALKENPKSWMIMQSIGNCEAELSHFDNAIVFYLKSIEAGGVHGIQCRNLAIAYERDGQPDKAAHWLKQGCSIDPTIAHDPQVKAAISRLEELGKNKTSHADQR